MEGAAHLETLIRLLVAVLVLMAWSRRVLVPYPILAREAAARAGLARLDDLVGEG
jgi:hypothetical protein